MIEPRSQSALLLERKRPASHNLTFRKIVMNLPRTFRILVFCGTAFASLLMLPSDSSAQGCALCVTQAAQGGNHFIQALRSGILVLVFPPMAISTGMIYISWRKRNQFRQR